jgi:hypothetical protein
MNLVNLPREIHALIAKNACRSDDRYSSWLGGNALELATTCRAMRAAVDAERGRETPDIEEWQGRELTSVSDVTHAAQNFHDFEWSVILCGRKVDAVV